MILDLSFFSLIGMDFLLVTPEFWILATALIFQFTSLFFPVVERVMSYLLVISLLFLSYLMNAYNLNGSGFNQVYYASDFTNLVKEYILILTSMVILIYMGYQRYYERYESDSEEFSLNFLNMKYLKDKPFIRSSYITLMLLSVIGMFLIISSRDFILLYMGVELQTLVLYIMAAFNTEDERSSESGLKYFILSALASGLMLFGMSYIYGFSGSLDFNVLNNLYSDQGNLLITASPAVVIGMVMVIAALCFKISAAPFHMWAPDVYEGSPIISTIFFASVPKLANIVALINILFFVFEAHPSIWIDIMRFVAVASLIVGSFGAIMQNSVKRLIAYSSIVNIGYICLAFASGNYTAIYVSVIYFMIYAISIIGFFATIISILPDKVENLQLEDLSGLGKVKKVAAMAITIFIFSMIGIPPVAGFFGKFYIFKAVIASENYVLAIAGVLASVVSAFYYLRIVKIMYFDLPRISASKISVSVNLYLVSFVCVIFTLCFIIFANQFLELFNFPAELIHD